MPTLNSGSSATLALPAGRVAQFFGTGMVQVVPPAPVYINREPILLIGGRPLSVGPFAAAVTLNIAAIGAAVEYWAEVPSDPIPVPGENAYVVRLSSLAALQTLSAGGQLDPAATYLDTSTGYKYQALNGTDFLSVGLSFDASVLNYVESGLLPPASGTIAAATLSAGVAYIEGNRVALAATRLVLTATRDNYIDLRRDGTVIVTAVTVAAASPAIPANSMRLGFSRTDATNVTLNSTNAFDTLGNWMGNVTPKPSCRLRSNTLQGSGGAEISVAFPETDIFDNASMHDPVTNNTRINFPSPGTYFMSCAIAFSAPQTPLSSFALYVRMNGATEEATFPQDSRGTAGAIISMQTSGFVTVPAAAGQYAEFRFIPNGVAGATLAAAWLQCTKVS
jgi:hypothetical protein